MSTLNNQSVCCFEPGAASRVGGHVYEDISGTVRANARDNQQAVCYGIDQQDGKGMAGYAEDVSPTMASDSHGTPHAVCYGISSYDSNSMKSNNPKSGIYEAETARTLDLNGGSPACNQGGMAVVQGADVYNGTLTGEIAATLNATSGGSPTHSGPSVVCLENHPNDSRVKISEDGKVQTLLSRMGTAGGNVPMVMEQPTCLTRRFSDVNIYENGITPTLEAGAGEGGNNMPMVMEPITASKASYFMKQHDDGVEETLVATDYKDPQLVAYGLDRVAYNQGQNAKFGFSVDEEKVGAQAAKGPGAVCNNYIVRRLTPLECERLQGFPDNWTNIGEWIDSKGKKHKDADSPRYKALGNSIALPFWEWMADRMVNVLKNEGIENPTMGSLFDGISGFCLVYKRCGCEPIWASEIEEFPIVVTTKHFGDEDKGIEGDIEKYL